MLIASRTVPFVRILFGGGKSMCLKTLPIISLSQDYVKVADQFLDVWRPCRQVRGLEFDLQQHTTEKTKE